MKELLEFYAEQEPYIAELRSRSSCSPACNHCCYPLLRYSVAEAILLLREYPLEPGVIDEARENLRVTANDPEAWLRRKYPCPFLRDDRCQVYSMRPWICRTHFVVGNPENCVSGTVRVLDITSSNPAYFEVMNKLKLPWGPNPISPCAKLGPDIPNRRSRCDVGTCKKRHDYTVKENAKVLMTVRPRHEVFPGSRHETKIPFVSCWDATCNTSITKPDQVHAYPRC